MSTEKRCGIYAIEHIATGRRYYGSTTNSYSRWCSHRSALRRGCHDNGRLQNAWSLYGEDAFRFVWVQDVPQEQLLAVEQQYLDANRDKGFNLAIFADAGTRGRKMGPASEERRQKISEALTGQKRSEESRERMRLAKQYTSEESRKKMSESQKARADENRAIHLGRKRSPETCQKISEALAGRTLSDEWKQHISEGMKGQRLGIPLAEETKKKLSEACMGRPSAFKGHHHTEETKAILREQHLGKTHSDETKAKIAAIWTGRKHTEETRAKMSESARALHAKRRAEKEAAESALKAEQEASAKTEATETQNFSEGTQT